LENDWQKIGADQDFQTIALDEENHYDDKDDKDYSSAPPNYQKIEDHSMDSDEKDD
jgi:hypothetical protein